MADRTSIEWTDATWNVINGCSVISPGCKHCYAMKLAGTRLRNHPSREALTIDTAAGPVWTGKTRLNEKVLLDPLRWRRPRRIFVCAHGDLFHESVPDHWIETVFAVMAMAPDHVFQVLTKRAERMRRFVAQFDVGDRIGDLLDQMDDLHPRGSGYFKAWPLPNVWLGVSGENQHWLMNRAPHLVETPAAKRFLSLEPALSEMDIEPFVLPVRQWSSMWANIYPYHYPKHRVDWVIVGGESGTGARPMPVEIPRQLRDQCAAGGVPFFFKQWGNYLPAGQLMADGNPWNPACGNRLHATKGITGRYLDGVVHDGMPV